MRTVLAVIALAGCNQVFGLESTQSVDASFADIDGDGVGDSIDNCPTHANPDQANTDGDTFGDACDTCPLLGSTSAHDEDRDHIGDDCDPCPGAPDFGVDFDGDGVGDLCDQKPKGPADRRVSFEPFATMPANWEAGGAAWTQASDAIAPANLLDASDPGLRQTAIATGAAGWTVTIGIEAKTAWDGSDTYGIVAASADDTVSCIVKCATAELGTTCIGYVTHNTSLMATIAVVPQPFVRIGIKVKDFGSAGCVFNGIREANGGVFPTSNMQLSLLASPRLRVTYFDYVE